MANLEQLSLCGPNKTIEPVALQSEFAPLDVAKLRNR